MPDYKSTLNLPRTSFAMKANLAQSEPQTLARWQQENLYQAVQAARAAEGAPHFGFHDGPPYANGAIHSGHMLNKVLKDIVVRSRLMEGMACPYVPGWDCHGLPIEHRVVTELQEKGKLQKVLELPDDQRRMVIRRECRASAEKFIKLQAGQMQRLLTLADYEHPYLTMDPAYEGAVLEVFAQLVEQGLVVRALKPVHWSIDNRTALAEAELEYEEREDPSVYVDFAATDRGAVEQAFGTELDITPSFMIWTTTPWTLPANLAIAVHPLHTYALVEVDGNVSVLAQELVERVTAAAGAEKVRTLATAPGSALVGLKYRHPFCEREGRIVAAEYVTLEDGTGLVHTAPGHGVDDYRTGLKEGLPIYCPVREDGTYDQTAPEWLRGKSVWEGNALVLEHLRSSGHLFHDQRLAHSYPHDWRGGSPVIFRATEQWFIGVDRPTARDGQSLRQMAIQAIGASGESSAGAVSGVAFVPEWGKNRMRGMLESRPDWCISRQRAWGLPIPAFASADGTVLLTPASVRAVAAAFRVHGSDAWFTMTPAQLLAGYDPRTDPHAPAGVQVGALAKTYDIFDVWFESGSSWNAVLRERGMKFPADLYLEGSDQHRGWFQLSLLPALGATGAAPFAALVTHGFIVDRNGLKMSKSKGNAIEVETLLKDSGAEVCRWWVSSVSYDADIRMDLAYLGSAGESYRKVRNTLRFLLSNLYDYTPAAPEAEQRALAATPPASIDAWALAELARVDREVRQAYRAYQFRDAHLALFHFCNSELSSVYFVATKDRLYCDAAGSPRRRQTQRAMHAIAERLIQLLSPVLPHTADEALAALRGPGAGSAALQTYGGALSSSLEGFACHPSWGQAMETRLAALRALEQAKAQGIENPLDAGLMLADPSGALEPLAPELADLMGVSRVRVEQGAAGVVVQDLRSEPRCERSRKRDGTVRTRSDGGLLSDRDALAVGAQ